MTGVPPIVCGVNLFKLVGWSSGGTTNERLYVSLLWLDISDITALARDRSYAHLELDVVTVTQVTFVPCSPPRMNLLFGQTRV